MSELAAELSRQAGKAIAYRDLPAAQYKEVLLGAGLPPPYAEVLADSDLGVARGELDGSSGDLRRLIGRATTPLAKAIATGLAQIAR
jgi:NAD(P)H dehydrogenase (quinone)